jgi:ribosomal protein S18 acetylase RimI-like enzyme
MITEATPTDHSVAIQLHAVMQAGYAREAERIGFAEFPPLRESSEELRRSSESFLVFQQSDRIIGGLSFRRSTDAVAITRLLVSPEHLQQGIATALLSALESRFPPRPRLTVSTAAAANTLETMKTNRVMNAPNLASKFMSLFLGREADVSGPYKTWHDMKPH